MVKISIDKNTFFRYITLKSNTGGVMQRVTTAEFVAMIEGLTGCTAISLDTETVPKLLKKNRITGEACPYENIVKTGTMAGLVI